MSKHHAIIIGDSTHNTLSVVRSLGKAKLSFTLILVGKTDSCNVKESKYVKRNQLITVDKVEECHAALENIEGGTIICTFDAAAEWVDANEPELSKRFITPCRGKHIGKLFNKEEQCHLAEQCGLTVPKSVILNKREKLTDLNYPILIKPLYSTKGEKGDIHICQNTDELNEALNIGSECTKFIAQEFIEKEYELDCIGISTEDNVILAGAVRKIRHYPDIIGAGAYGIFIPIHETDIDVPGVSKFVRESNYHGPFSVEFLHHGNQNHFMEVNFRNEGLAQVATDAGANLHALYLTGEKRFLKPVKHIYMMNYSIDYLHVKEGRVSKWNWWRDFLRTRCFINFSPSDPMPTIKYYLSKFIR